jgi:adenylate cyclase
MGKLDDYKSGVGDFFSGEYEVVKTTSIPQVSDLKFGKHGKQVELAMLFIDLRDSTKIMASVRRVTAARIYKSFLWGISKIAKDNGGEVRSFNGDGVLVAFVGNRKCNNAVKAALQMKYFCREVLKPKADAFLKDKGSLNGILFDFGIGIDVGTVLVVRGGISGDNNNDLVWVSNATNRAVKISGISNAPYNIRITEDVYSYLEDDRKFSEGISMWEERYLDNIKLYRTSYYWKIPN